MQRVSILSLPSTVLRAFSPAHRPFFGDRLRDARSSPRQTFRLLSPSIGKKTHNLALRIVGRRTTDCSFHFLPPSLPFLVFLPCRKRVLISSSVAARTVLPLLFPGKPGGGWNRGPIRHKPAEIEKLYPTNRETGYSRYNTLFKLLPSE